MFIEINGERVNITKIATISRYEDRFIKYTMINGTSTLVEFESTESRDSDYLLKAETLLSKSK